jgi:hypothetical protein
MTTLKNITRALQAIKYIFKEYWVMVGFMSEQTCRKLDFLAARLGF